MKELRVNTGTVELQIRDYERDAPAILFLHFSGANLMMWERAVPYFKEHFRLILVDLRGHGRSDKPLSGYQIGRMAQDIAGLMDAIELPQAHIVGCSVGAEVGLSLAANHPQRALSLVCDGALYSEFGPYGIWEGSQQEYEAYTAENISRTRQRVVPVYASLDEFMQARRLALEPSGLWNPYIESMTAWNASEIAPGQFSQAWRPAALAEYLEDYYACRFENDYRKLKCPLLMTPDEDALQDTHIPSAMQGLSALAPQARIVSVPGWDHPYGWLVDPHKISETILEFILSCQAAG